MTTKQASFTAEQSAAIKAAAVQFAQSEVFGEEAVKATAAVMGTTPTYTFWGLVSTQFVTDYTAARKCSEDAANKAWQRMARRMKDAYGLEKPKAPSEKAGKVAASRAKKEKALLALVAKHKTEALLNRMAGEAMEQGKAELGDQLRDAAKLAKKQAEAKAKESQKARWEKLLERVREAKKLHDARILEAIEKAIATLVPTKGTK